MGSYIYGVDKCDGEWRVWRFSVEDADDAVRWVARGASIGVVRWLCERGTAAEMAGGNAMSPNQLIIWGDET